MTYCLRLCSIAGLLLALVGLGACLPEDPRPQPGRLVVTVSGDEAIASGFTSLDGWQVAYDRFLISLGNVWPDRTPELQSCEPYSGVVYWRILDLKQPGPQRLATSYALGGCVLRWQLGSPSADDIVLGSGVSEETKAFMLATGSDAFVSDRGVALHVAGTAVRDETAKRFAWSFRQAIDYETCEETRFVGGKSRVIELTAHGALLFHDRPALESAENVEPAFDRYAGADADGDGEITLAELTSVTASDDQASTTSAERLYLDLVPQLFTLEGMSPCSVAPN